MGMTAFYYILLAVHANFPVIITSRPQEQKNVLEAQLENQKCVQKMKHDMKGHTVTLAGLLSKGQVNEELPYMELCQILSNGIENACDELKGLDIENRRCSATRRMESLY